MTTQRIPALETTSSGTGRKFIMTITGLTAAAAIALGVRAWHATDGPSGQTVTAGSPTSTTSSPAIVGTHARVEPLGGLAELYAEHEREAADTGRIDTLGGMAELYRDQAASHAATGGAREVGRPASTSAPGNPIAQSLVYVTASHEDAAFLRRFSAEINALRVQNGQQPVEVGVLVMDGVDTSVLDGHPRPPGTIVIDLRAP